MKTHLLKNYVKAIIDDEVKMAKVFMKEVQTEFEKCTVRCNASRVVNILLAATETLCILIFPPIIGFYNTIFATASILGSLSPAILIVITKFFTATLSTPLGFGLAVTFIVVSVGLAVLSNRMHTKACKNNKQVEQNIKLLLDESEDDKIVVLNTNSENLNDDYINPADRVEPVTGIIGSMGID